MRSLVNSRARRLRLAALGLLVVVLGAVVAPVQAYEMPPGPTTTVPVPSPVDAYSAYVGQTTCDPTTKPGAQAVLALAMNYYKIGRNTGITRACSIGGASEHKEGRAFDWGLNVANPAEKAAGDAFTHWLTAAGPDGKPGYNARRLGVMYVIWNKKIWTAYGASAGWKDYYGASPHTDHVHVSLSWNGAYMRTSWWTGSLVAQKPIGHIDAVTATRSSITVRGWAMDPDTSNPTDVHVYVDGASVAVRADDVRTDIGEMYGRGDKHGFSWTTPASTGSHRVCVYAIDSDPRGNAPLGCRDVVVQDSAPTGVIDTVTTTATTLTVSGWSLDPDTDAPIAVHVYVDGRSAGVRADGSRPDVGRVFGRGDNHGYTYTTTASPGRHEVCVYGINADPGAHTLLGCRFADVPTAAPIGVVDRMSGEYNGITVEGWALDPDTTEPTDVHVYVDGVGAAVRADGLRPDVGAVHRKGDRHGFTYVKPLPAGRHEVCVWGINTGTGPHTGLGCRSVTVISNAAPWGVIDAVTPAKGALTVSGWVIDPDTTDPIDVHVYVDGVSVGVRADGSRPDVDAVFGRGDRHGYSYTRTVAPGSHKVCVYGIDNRGVAHASLGCRTVQVTS